MISYHVLLQCALLDVRFVVKNASKAISSVKGPLSPKTTKSTFAEHWPNELELRSNRLLSCRQMSKQFALHFWQAKFQLASASSPFLPVFTRVYGVINGPDCHSWLRNRSPANSKLLSQLKTFFFKSSGSSISLALYRPKPSRRLPILTKINGRHLKVEPKLTLKALSAALSHLSSSLPRSNLLIFFFLLPMQKPCLNNWSRAAWTAMARSRISVRCVASQWEAIEQSKYTVSLWECICSPLAMKNDDSEDFEDSSSWGHFWITGHHRTPEDYKASFSFWNSDFRSISATGLSLAGHRWYPEERERNQSDFIRISPSESRS